MWLYIGAAACLFMLGHQRSIVHSRIHWRHLYGLVSCGKILDYPENSCLTPFCWVYVYFNWGCGLPYRYCRRFTTVAAEGEEAGFDPGTYVGIMAMLIGMILGALMIQLGADVGNKPVTAAFQSLKDRLVDLAARQDLYAVIISLLLHTTFFSNIGGLGQRKLGPQGPIGWASKKFSAARSPGIITCCWCRCTNFCR